MDSDSQPKQSSSRRQGNRVATSAFRTRHTAMRIYVDIGGDATKARVTKSTYLIEEREFESRLVDGMSDRFTPDSSSLSVNNLI